MRRLRMRSLGVRGVIAVSAIVVTCLVGRVAPVSAQSSATLSSSDVAIACAPTLTLMPEQAPVHSLRVIGAQDTAPRVLFGTRELVVVSGGTGEGVQLDQRYAIR